MKTCGNNAARECISRLKYDDSSPEGISIEAVARARDKDRTDKLNFFVIAIGESAGLRTTQTRYIPHLLCAAARGVR